LRGIPELSIKMKRPPKVRNAASAARNAAGAGTGNPDFYRIEKIAPLPPSAPFIPVVKESTKSASDCSSEAQKPRYVIQHLTENNEEGKKMEELEDIHLAGWMLEEQTRMPDLEFDDPFENNPETEHQGVAPVQGKQDDGNRKSEGSGREEKENQTDATPATAILPANPSADRIYQELSKADIGYLAHQNRILRSHLGKKWGAEGEGSATESPTKMPE
jgi:hypothetical protein